MLNRPQIGLFDRPVYDLSILGAVIRLQEAKLNQNYAILNKSLCRDVLPVLGYTNYTSLPISKKSARYFKLCRHISDRLGFLIEQELYGRHLHPHYYIDPAFSAVVIFHYCQVNAKKAGQILNKNIWKQWRSHISEWLIESGADVNAKADEAAYSSLFHAVRSNSDVLVNKLLDAGADYYAYKEERNGITYTLMLLAALESPAEIIVTLVKRFPQEVAPTIDALDKMLTADSNNKFSCLFADFEAYVGQLKISHYTKSEIELAKKSLSKVYQTCFPDSSIITSEKCSLNVIAAMKP